MQELPAASRPREEMEKGLQVRVSTLDGTMKAGTNQKMPGYERMEKALVEFKPNSCVAEVVVKLVNTRFWGPELYFRVLVNGRSGFHRSCMCIVWDDQGHWPLRTWRQPRGKKLWKNLGFVWDVLRQVAVLRGYNAEMRQLFHCVVNAVYETAVSNYIFTVYFIDVCIGESHYIGLVYVAIIYGFVLCLKRLRTTVPGTEGVRMHHKRLIILKSLSGLENFVDNTPHKIYSLHTKVVDDSIEAFSTAVYNLLDDIVSIIVAPIYMIYMATANTKSSSFSDPKILGFQLIPLLVMMVCSFYVGVYRKHDDRNKLIDDVVTGYEEYMDRLGNVMGVKGLLDAHTTANAGIAEEILHKEGTFEYTKAWLKYFAFFRSDVLHLLDALSTATYTSALVVLALLHIESKDYGTCDFSFSHLLMSVRVYQSVKSNLNDMAQNLQKLFQGFQWVVCFNDFINAPPSVTARAHWTQEQLERLPLNVSSPTEFMEKMSMPLTMQVRGVSVQLGSSVLLQGDQDTLEAFCHELVGSGRDALQLPPFCRVVHLTGSTPPFKGIEDPGDFLLAFAEPGRFTKTFAEELLSELTKSTRACSKTNRRGTACSMMMDSASSRSEMEVVTRKAGQLAQAMLADPEVLVLDLFFASEGVKPSQCNNMLRAALDWQRGGPEAVVGQTVPMVPGMGANVRAKGLPEWLGPDGYVQRTLLLHLAEQHQTLKAVEGITRLDLDMLSDLEMKAVFSEDPVTVLIPGAVEP